MSRLACPYCARSFVDANGLWQHARTKHYGKGREKAINALRPRRVEDDEPSMADLMIKAQLDRAMGDPIPGWLADMMP